MIKNNSGKWKGSFEAKCGGCNYTEVIEIVLPEKQSNISVNYTCPRCGVKKFINVSRVQMKNVDVTG